MLWMPNDPTSRSDELAALGWPAEEVARYVELWGYRRRWGSMNLEREDRLFLRRAEAALPPLPTGKASTRKSIREKSYYRWLRFHLEAMRAAEAAMTLSEGEVGVWPVMLEEEIRVLESCQPVLGLPDTIKARDLSQLRERWAEEAASVGRCLEFDFAAPLVALKQQQFSSWKPLREGGQGDDRLYPVIAGEALSSFRSRAAAELAERISSTFPSLADTASTETESQATSKASAGG